MNKAAKSNIFPFLWMRGEPEPVLREEVLRIAQSGIGGVCVESRPHPDFLGPLWWRDMDLLMALAAEYGMEVWVLDDAHFPTGYAAGAVKKHPEKGKLYLRCAHADVCGALVHAELDCGALMEKELTWRGLLMPNEPPLMQEKRLLSVTARRLAGGEALGGECIDLTERVENGRLRFDLPAGQWRVLLSFLTREGGGDPNYINIIDRSAVGLLIDTVYAPHAERYGALAGSTFMGFFSDEPCFGNEPGFDAGAVGRRRMALPWCGELPALLRAALGEKWTLLLPLLWADCADEREAARVRLAYMDAVTRLYQKNFSEQIGAWCAKRGLMYVGHVVEDNGAHSRLGCGAGHYFRAQSGQHMAGIDVIGGQICVGGGTQIRHGFGDAEGAFFHNALVPMGASAAMLDQKKQGRLLCELYGAYGWTTGVRDMKWITDFLLARGVNRLVPHAFSMAAYPDGDCPPHFYARGHNPQYAHFGALMRYADRLCTLFSGGVGGARAALIYPAENDWMGESMPLETPAEALNRAQVDFWVLPEDALQQALPEGVEISLWIVPQTRFLSLRAARAIARRGRRGTVFVGARPTMVPDAEAAEETELLAALGACEVVPLDRLGAYCRERGLLAGLAEPAFEQLRIYRYWKDGAWQYMLFNESAEAVFDGTVTLAGGERLGLRLCPYEAAVLAGGEFVIRPAPAPMAAAECIDVSDNWRLSLAEAGGAFSEPQPMEKLLPVSDTRPQFAGWMRYERTLTLDEAPQRAVLEAEWLYETADIYVDGVLVNTRLTPPYRFDLSGALHAGENRIRVDAACPPARDAVRLDKGPFGPSRSVIEPTGMFGKITLEYI